MKTIIVIFSIALLVACQPSPKKPLTMDEMVRVKTEEYLQHTLNDPDSYEFVGLVLLDSVLYKENVEYRKDWFTRQLDYKQGNLEWALNWKKEFPSSSMYDEQDVLEIKADIEENTKILAEIDSLERAMGNMVNDVASYTYFFSFRAINAMGAKVLEQYYLQTGAGPNYEVLNLEEDMKGLYVNPEEFPGYEEMILRHRNK